MSPSSYRKRLTARCLPQRLLARLAWLLLVTLLAGCTAAPTTPTSDLVRAVATTAQIADLLTQIAGDKVDIRVIVKNGMNHHTFEPTASDVKELVDAQIVFESGAGLDRWLDRLLASSNATAMRVDTSEGVQLQTFSQGGSNRLYPGGDPHYWHSPANTKIVVGNIARGMSEVDPANQAFYEANAQAYTAQLEELEQEIQALIDPIPPERRKLVTSHEALGYFASQFGLRLVGTITIGGQTAEPSSRQVAALIERIRAEQVPAIFTEATFDPQVAEQVAAEAGIEVIPNLYTDSLSDPGGEADTYIAMMRYNAQVIAAGLSE
jgi:zinc/manganese transport system substrate-binding protein